MRPLIIIGAPRSGTNILRDVLTALPGLETWPCDEINLLWRHGNARQPYDALAPELATEAVQRYMRGRFERLAQQTGCDTVVEKTCANSLRVEFVDRIFPEASYVLIERDPVDAVASAMQRWMASFNIGYTMRKARYVPLADVPLYGARFLRNRLHRLTTGSGRLATWGPVFEGLREAAALLPLEEVCALQWKVCVTRARASFERIAPARVFRLQYEDFVRRPASSARDLSAFLQLDVDDAAIASATADVRSSSVGKGRATLSDEQRRRVEAFVAETAAASASPNDGAAGC